MTPEDVDGLVERMWWAVASEIEHSGSNSANAKLFREAIRMVHALCADNAALQARVEAAEKGDKTEAIREELIFGVSLIQRLSGHLTQHMKGYPLLEQDVEQFLRRHSVTKEQPR